MRPAPSTSSLTVSRKTVPVTVDASAVTISSGYMNKTTMMPAEITLRGPTSELDQVCPASSPPVQMDGDAWLRQCLLRWSCARRGGATPSRHQYISMDSDSANVTLTVYPGAGAAAGGGHRRAERPSTSSLHYSLNQQTCAWPVPPARSAPWRP